MAKQHLILGDIHSCYHEMLQVIQIANRDHGFNYDNDEVISIGDLIDRGPHAVEVFNFFRGPNHLIKNRRAIRGNHEDKHILAHEGKCDPALSQLITYQDMGTKIHEDYLEFCRNLPFYIELGDAILVHGYWEPTVSLENQKPQVLKGSLSGSRHIERNYERPSGKKWYQLYDGNKPLIFGHHNYLSCNEVLQDQGLHAPVFGIDQSCATGGMLTGLLLPSFKIIQVAAKEDYWTRIKTAYKKNTPIIWG